MDEFDDAQFWCTRCKAAKNSEKHKKHKDNDKAYRRQYRQSERGKKSYRSTHYKKNRRIREQNLKNNNRCVKHPKREAVTTGHCEECWWGFIAYKNLNSSTLRHQLRDFIEKQVLCVYSGIPLEVRSNFQLDHFIPVCRGGSKSLDNVGGTTAAVNALKGALTHEEFLIACKLRWEKHQAGDILTDDRSLLMIQIWDYQLTKPIRPALFNTISWLP